MWGEPSQESAKELRWGIHGSRSLKRETGQWFDHERNEGGSTIELLKRELGLSFSECRAWLQDEGLIGSGRTNGKTSTKTAKIVASYPYHDESGQLLFEVVRFEP